MAHRLAAVVGQQILLRDIGDIFRFLVFSEEMVIGLILVRADFFGDGFIPFFGIVELRINVENDAAEWINPVLDNLSNLEFGISDHNHGGNPFADRSYCTPICQDFDSKRSLSNRKMSRRETAISVIDPARGNG